MRIGEFAKKNNLSIDTIRWYIQLNLIHPLRKGAYYYFELEQQQQLDKILKYKEMKFSLEEIKRIIQAEKLSILETKIKSNLIIEMLMTKKDEVEQEIHVLTDTLTRLNHEIERAKNNRDKNVNCQGIKFTNLEILSCPHCQQKIIFKDGILKDNRIFSGKALCTCGYLITVNEGIIISSQSPEKVINPVAENQNQIQELITSMPQPFIELMLHYLEELVRYFENKDLSEKIILSIKSGVGTLGLNLLNKCPEIHTLILVEEDLQKLKIAKRSIDKHYQNKNVLYICSTLNSLPLRRKSIDIAIDFLATFVSGFQTADNLYDFLLPYMKPKDSSISGLYFYFKDFAIRSRIEQEKRKLFDEVFLKNYLKQNGFHEIASYAEKVLKEVSFHDFFQEGDQIYASIKVYQS